MALRTSGHAGEYGVTSDVGDGEGTTSETTVAEDLHLVEDRSAVALDKERAVITGQRVPRGGLLRGGPDGAGERRAGVTIASAYQGPDQAGEYQQAEQPPEPPQGVAGGLNGLGHWRDRVIGGDVVGIIWVIDVTHVNNLTSRGGITQPKRGKVFKELLALDPADMECGLNYAECPVPNRLPVGGFLAAPAERIIIQHVFDVGNHTRREVGREAIKGALHVIVAWPATIVGEPVIA